MGLLENGQIVDRVLVIFERFNFIAVLEKQELTPKVSRSQSCSSNDFRVIDSGEMRDHQNLMEKIRLLNIDLPEQYFSLIKFVSLVDNGNIVARPMKSGNCYFGYEHGLAIVFNSNNGVVSVGVHSQGRITEFGGKYS